MGVDIADIVPSDKKRLKDLRGRTVAIDAFNAIYQFLAIIRQPDGTPLRDSRGRTTSHLSGLVYRNANLLQMGIRPVYVFDGEPPKLKSTTIATRMAAREIAEKEWREALAVGDLERARIKAQASSRLSKEMVEQSKELLTFLGIPHVQAPCEGEAQASDMTKKGDVWAAASQDFDSLLFGAPRLLRNLTISGRRRAARGGYVEAVPELVSLESTLEALQITREQLVGMALLVGTDFNEGIKGIGPKKALLLIRRHGDIETVCEKEGFDIENVQEIRQLFLEPVVSDDYQLEWSEPDVDGTVSYLRDEFDFSEKRVRKALQKIAEGRSLMRQRSLNQWV
ncbi:MAG: flap endonuclease-1 [Thermoplasmata archaeon]